MLIPTRLVELREYGSDPLIVSGIWIDVQKAAHQRRIFGTEFLTQFISLLAELLSFYGVFLLIDLVIEFNNFAVRLAFAFISADDFDEIFRLRLQLDGVWLLSLRKNRRYGDSQNRSYQSQAHCGGVLMLEGIE